MEWMNLGDLISIKKGKKLLEVDEPTENSIRYIQIEDLRDDNNLKYTEDDKAVLADSDDILIAWDGANAGTIGFGISGAIGSTIAKLSIKKSFRKKFTYEFLGYFLKSKNNYLVTTSTGATIPHISRNTLIKIKVPIIDLEEQEKLIGILKNLENLIQTRKDQIQALDDLVDSVLNNLIEKYINNQIDIEKILVEIISGKSLAGEESSSYKVLKTSCLYSGYFNDNEWKNLPIDYTPNDDHFIKKDDILVSRMNTEELVGANAYVWKDYDNLTVPDRIWRLITNSKIDNIYLWKFLQTQIYRSQISKISTGTSGSMKNISQKNFSSIKIVLPPLDQQNKFASLVEKIEDQKEILNNSLIQLTNLFDCLMQDAFDGSLIK